MNENRFFTWVWRFNGLVIAITVTLILIVILWQLTRDLRRQYFPQRTTEVINVVPAASAPDAQQRDVQQTARYGAPQEAASRGIYAVPQYVDQVYSNRGISKESGGNRVNFLVVDTGDQSTRWLFEGTHRLIADVRPLWHQPQGAKRRLLGHLLHVIDSDTNGDTQLSRQDTGTLYLVSPDWGPPIALSGALRQILSLRIIDAATFEVLGKGDDDTSLRRFALPDAAQVFEVVLPPQD